MATARASLLDTILDSQGKPVTSATVTLRQPGTASPIAETIYSGLTGGATLSNPLVSDAHGGIGGYLDTPRRVDAYVQAAGMSPFTVPNVPILPDPADMVLLEATQVLRNKTFVSPTLSDAVLDAPILVDPTLSGTIDFGGAISNVLNNAGAYALTLQNTGAGQKALMVLDGSSNTALEVAALGSGPYSSSVATYIPGILSIGPTRNWTANSHTFFAGDKSALAGHHDSFVTSVITLRTCNLPSDGYNGVADIPDEAALSVVAFALNAAGGGAQNGDGTVRAAEFQNVIYGSTGKKRTMATLEVGSHTASSKLSLLDSGSPDTAYGDIAVLAISQDQPYTGYGTAAQSNGAFWSIGGKGFKFPFAALHTDNSLLWSADSGGSVNQKGNHYWFGAGVLLQGDMTTGTYANRLLWQTSTANSKTEITTRPSGSGSVSGFVALARNDTLNTEFLRLVAQAGDVALWETFKSGTATAQDIGLSPNQVATLRLRTAGVTDHVKGSAFSGKVSPSTLGSNTNDWDPTGSGAAAMSQVTVVRMSASTPINLTGVLAPSIDNAMVVFQNVGANAITLPHEDTGSSAVNRWNLASGSSIVVPVHGVVIGWYDTGRWKVWGRSV